ncbi:unnamed protein product [Closterium sp. NIES-54]
MTQAILLVSFCVAVTQSLAALRPSSLSASNPSSRASSSSRASVPFLGMFPRPNPISAAAAAAAAATAASEPAGKEWAEWGVLACCLPYLRRAYILIHYLGIMPLREPPLVDHRVKAIQNLSPQVLLADWLRRSLALPSVTSVLRLMASANSEASSCQPWHLSRMFASWNLPSVSAYIIRCKHIYPVPHHQQAYVVCPTPFHARFLPPLPLPVCIMEPPVGECLLCMHSHPMPHL